LAELFAAVWPLCGDVCRLIFPCLRHEAPALLIALQKIFLLNHAG
jgi:hypothetical protein